MEDHSLVTRDELPGSETRERLTAEEKRALKFPDFSKAFLRVQSYNTEDIFEFLAGLKTRINDGGRHAHVFAGQVIKEFIAANVVLNERVGLKRDPGPAPAFRPQPRRNNQPKENMLVLSNVAQVIDLHFMWVLGLRFEGDVQEAAIFGETFEFDEAYRHVNTRGNIPVKLEALGLNNSYDFHFSRIGSVVLSLPDDRDHQLWVKRARERYLNKLNSRPVPASVDRREWADLVTADGLLERLGLKTDGRALMAVTALLGRYMSDRPREYERKLKCAQAAVNLPARSTQSKNKERT
ncbi:MAG: hypothetical protein AAGA50_29975 [Pseudomonadota bacterium]